MTDSRLLGKTEREKCEAIAASAAGLDGQRATALLALDAGTTQTAAAGQAGLTLGQVRYLLTTFRNKGMAIFAASAPQAPAAGSGTPAGKEKSKKKDKGDKKKDKKDKGKKKKEKTDKKKDKKPKKKKKK